MFDTGDVAEVKVGGCCMALCASRDARLWKKQQNLHPRNPLSVISSESWLNSGLRPLTCLGERDSCSTGVRMKPGRLVLQGHRTRHRVPELFSFLFFGKEFNSGLRWSF